MTIELFGSILFGVWLLAAGLVFRITVKKDFDKFGVPNWQKKQ